MRNRRPIQRIIWCHWPKPAFRLIAGEQTHLLLGQHGRLPGHHCLALEDDRSVVCRRHDGILRMHPIGGDDAEDVVDFESAARVTLEVGELLVVPVQVHLDAVALVGEGDSPMWG